MRACFCYLHDLSFVFKLCCFVLLRCAAPNKAAAAISVQFDVLELRPPIVSHDFDQRVDVFLNCFAFYDLQLRVDVIFKLL